MSAIGTKRTYAGALHMSAFGGKADMPFALQMSAFDPKRTLGIGGAAIKPNEVTNRWLPVRATISPRASMAPLVGLGSS